MPVVIEALWDATQDIFTRSAENRARRPKRQGVALPHAYYLRGLVVCQHCGAKMTTADHIGRRAPVHYYECVRAVKFDACCPVKRVDADLLHGAVVAEIQRMAAGRAAATEARDAEAERFTLQQEQQRARKDLATAKVTRPTVADVHRLFGRFAGLWETATEETRTDTASTKPTAAA